jgi:hypothetical protein
MEKTHPASPIELAVRAHGETVDLDVRRLARSWLPIREWRVVRVDPDMAAARAPVFRVTPGDRAGLLRRLPGGSLSVDWSLRRLLRVAILFLWIGKATGPSLTLQFPVDTARDQLEAIVDAELLGLTTGALDVGEEHRARARIIWIRPPVDELRTWLNDLDSRPPHEGTPRPYPGAMTP